MAAETGATRAEKEITGETIFQARLGVESTETDNETIIGDLLSNRYFRVNSTGAFLWRIARSDAPLAQIVSAFSKEYGVEKELAYREVKEFLIAMVHAGLLTHTSA
jgi:hypothetical protein